MHVVILICCCLAGTLIGNILFYAFVSGKVQSFCRRVFRRKQNKTNECEERIRLKTLTGTPRDFYKEYEDFKTKCTGTCSNPYVSDNDPDCP